MQPVQPLSPVMETSREHNYRASSSSSDTSQSHYQPANKSQWGNNSAVVVPSLPMGVASSSSCSGHVTTRTPGTSLSNRSALKSANTEISSCTSGYMADASSARTPGDFLIKASGKGRPLIASPQQASGKREGRVLEQPVLLLAQELVYYHSKSIFQPKGLNIITRRKRPKSI